MTNYPPGANTTVAPWNIIEILCPACGEDIAYDGEDIIECPACGYLMRRWTPDPDQLRDERDDV